VKEAPAQREKKTAPTLGVVDEERCSLRALHAWEKPASEVKKVAGSHSLGRKPSRHRLAFAGEVFGFPRSDFKHHPATGDAFPMQTASLQTVDRSLFPSAKREKARFFDHAGKVACCACLPSRSKIAEKKVRAQ